jgi:hypothetical protein
VRRRWAGVGLGPEVGSITIDIPSQQIERGTTKKFVATVKDPHVHFIDVPLVWLSSNTRVATFDANAVLTALVTGSTSIVASSLGVESAPIGINVVWNGAAKLLSIGWTQPNAVTPGAVVSDSIRVGVANLLNNAVPFTRVAFAVTAGGGTVSPAVVVVPAAKVRAATHFPLGSKSGLNSISATVVDTANQPITFVQANPVKLAVTAYAALSAVAGDQQSGQILANLPVEPSVRLVDSLGKPRVGVPITFTASNGGRVPTPTVSTGDGSASPGTWTLRRPASRIWWHASKAGRLLQATATGRRSTMPAHIASVASQRVA